VAVDPNDPAAAVNTGLIQLGAMGDPVENLEVPYVRALAVDGDLLYVAGNFGTPSASAPGVGAFDLNRHRFTSFRPSAMAGVQNAALAAEGGRVIAGGQQSRLVNGVRRTGLAAYDRATRRILDWSPDVAYSQWGGEVYALLVAEDRLYFGGSFDRVNGQPRQGLAALNLDGSVVEVFSPALPEDSQVNALAVRGDTVYAGGYFSTAGGSPRAGAAAFGPEGALLP
jgi:hypothetical protein